MIGMTGSGTCHTEYLTYLTGSPSRETDGSLLAVACSAGWTVID